MPLSSKDLSNLITRQPTNLHCSRWRKLISIIIIILLSIYTSTLMFELHLCLATYILAFTSEFCFLTKLLTLWAYSYISHFCYYKQCNKEFIFVLWVLILLLIMNCFNKALFARTATAGATSAYAPIFTCNTMGSTKSTRALALSYNSIAIIITCCSHHTHRNLLATILRFSFKSEDASAANAVENTAAMTRVMTRSFMVAFFLLNGDWS